MNLKLLFFLSFFVSAGVALGQDTTSFKTSKEIEVSSERTRNPETKPNPHPGGLITSERTRQPLQHSPVPDASSTTPVVTEKRKGNKVD